MKGKIEILAPAGEMESLKAAVSCGTHSVYLGGLGLNARQGAKNFDKTQLTEAVAYCHARGVKVHQTLNTIVFDGELKEAERVVRDGAEAGVDAFIIQDLGVLEIAQRCTPEISLHASTQLSVHSLAGALELAELGFSRVVLARELTLDEIRHIAQHSPIEVECFVHGALCMSVSGQCYLSSMIGGRSGNRGRCAQPCRLPFSSGGSSHSLSLKDLSAVNYIPDLIKAGVASLKIEGRLKRPEYVAAAVTACVDAIEGRTPDYKALENIFSRSGFTDGYLSDKMGDEMFGTRTKADVASTQGSLKALAGLYHREAQRVPVDFQLSLRANAPAVLTASTGGYEVEVQGDTPQKAITAPTDYRRAEKSLEKTGNTPFYLNKLQCSIDEGLMLPSSGLNGLRRDALDTLLALLESPAPKGFTPYAWAEGAKKYSAEPAKLRGRFSRADQLWEGAFDQLDSIILPIEEGLSLPQYKEKIILELPRVVFSRGGQSALEAQLDSAKAQGFSQVIVGGIGQLHTAKERGFTLHGDFGLNVVNHLSVEKYTAMGLDSVTMSLEYGACPKEPLAEVPKGIIIYGSLPMMVFRNHPAGLKGRQGTLTDRLGNSFRVERQGEVSVLENSVPLFLADKLEELQGFSFMTLYFTTEAKAHCEKVYSLYVKGEPMEKPFTRGLYRRRVL